MKKLLIALCIVFPLLVVKAELTVNNIFGNHMILQRNAPIKVWGTDSSGSIVRVQLGNEFKTVNVDKVGKWEVTFSARKASAKALSLKITGSGLIEFSDILIGDIWVCSGQSNMEMPLRSAKNAKAEIAAANYPDIRLMTVPHRPAYKTQRNFSVRAVWRHCTPQGTAWFSAVAYFFGRDLYTKIKIPIGLIDASWGGTCIESWLCPALIDDSPLLKPIKDRYLRSVRHLTPDAEAAYNAKVSQWRIDVKKNKSLPRPKAKWGRKQYHLGTLYYGMINPIMGLPIKGVVWYQGEGNAKRAFQYRTLLRFLINDWREKWKCGDFPFLIVQLPNYKLHTKGPATKQIPQSWAELREAQQMALKLPNTELAVTCDIGEANNVHPLNKQDVGSRLALAAEGRFYGKKIVFSGPRFSKVEFTGSNAKLFFNHVGGGLKNCKKLKYFELAGKDHKFHSAQAHTENNQVIVFSAEVPEPVAVRYAWLNNPEDCNFFNREGLPAMPFRTDDWPGNTEKYR